MVYSTCDGTCHLLFIWTKFWKVPCKAQQAIERKGAWFEHSTQLPNRSKETASGTNQEPLENPTFDTASQDFNTHVHKKVRDEHWLTMVIDMIFYI